MGLCLVLKARKQLLFIADFLSSLILFTLMMEAIRFPETLVLTTATQCHIPEYSIILIKLLNDYYVPL
jgi:hypothetical protein